MRVHGKYEHMKLRKPGKFGQIRSVQMRGE
jgi:hypothetical protein